MKPHRAISNADRYMLLASDAHAAADQMSDFASKNEMRQIARGYERLALLAFQRLAPANNSALHNSAPERA